MKKKVFGHIEEHQDDWWLSTKSEIIIALMHKIFPSRSILILDVASGTGFLAQQVQRAGYQRIVTSDRFASALKLLKKKFAKVLSINLPQPLPIKARFDCILVLDVLEHIEDDYGSLKEIAKVLKPDGKMILTVPAWQFLWSQKDEMVQHKRRYSKKSFVRLLEKNNLTVEYVSYYNFFLFIPAVLYALLNRSSEKTARYSQWQNVLFRPIFQLEKPLITRFFHFPWGVSLIAVVSKKQK